MDKWLSVKEAAKILEVSRRWVTELISLGKLEAYRIGRRWRVNAESLSNYIIECNKEESGNE